MNTQRAKRSVWLAALVGLAMALGAGVTPASAQEDVDPRLERIRAELPEEAVTRIEARLDAARAAGLPVEPLLDKAVEGMAKRVPPPAIAGAVDQLAVDLGRAQTLLADGTPPTPTDVAAVADAMRRGVPEPAIQQVAQGANPEEPVALAVHTMGDLMDRGVPVDQALAVLEAWRGRGARAEELRELPAAVERLIRQGVLPGQAAAAVAESMRGQAGQQRGPNGARGRGRLEGGPPIPPGAGPPDDRGRNPRRGTPNPGGNGGGA